MWLSTISGVLGLVKLNFSKFLVFQVQILSIPCCKIVSKCIDAMVQHCIISIACTHRLSKGWIQRLKKGEGVHMVFFL